MSGPLEEDVASCTSTTKTRELVKQDHQITQSLRLKRPSAYDGFLKHLTKARKENATTQQVNAQQTNCFQGLRAGGGRPLRWLAEAQRIRRSGLVSCRTELS